MRLLLQFLSLCDRYERKAVILPGLLLAAVPALTAGVVLQEFIAWPKAAGSAVGVELLAAIILGHFARARGRRVEAVLWKAWGGPPTTRWLRPWDQTCSDQQKSKWRGVIKRLTGLSLPASVPPSGISRKLSLPENAHVFSTRTAESMEVAGHPVMIHGRGFPNRAVPENLVLDYPAAIPNKFNLGILHTSLTGRPGHNTYAPCSETDLRQKGYDYWALGHIHQPEVISQDPWIVFAGNCQGRDAREVGPRGCQLVTVNDLLEVEKAEWHNLDVVRWQVLEIDLTGVTEESVVLSRVTTSMASAVSEAEGRLVAARVEFTGATPLHGSLHRESHRWRAEVLGRAQDQGEEAIWIEQIKVSTSPVYDLAQLAERDSLTKIVLETLEQARIESGNLPDEVKEMLDVLPPEVRREVESDWDENQQAAAMEDVRAIILDSLGTKGGKTS